MNPIEIKSRMTDEEKAKQVTGILTGKLTLCSICGNYQNMMGLLICEVDKEFKDHLKKTTEGFSNDR